METNHHTLDMPGLHKWPCALSWSAAQDRTSILQLHPWATGRLLLVTGKVSQELSRKQRDIDFAQIDLFLSLPKQLHCLGASWSGFLRILPRRDEELACLRPHSHRRGTFPDLRVPLGDWYRVRNSDQAELVSS